jgi:hypothetical protein
MVALRGRAGIRRGLWGEVIGAGRDVPADAEGSARTRDDQGTHLIACIGVIQDSAQAVPRRRVQGVAALWTIDTGDERPASSSVRILSVVRPFPGLGGPPARDDGRLGVQGLGNRAAVHPVQELELCGLGTLTAADDGLGQFQGAGE